MEKDVAAPLTEFVVPEPDEDILALKQDFNDYCDRFDPERETEDLIENEWGEEPSELLSGLTPCQFIEKYAGDPPSFEKYEKLLLYAFADGFFEIPLKCLIEFEELFDEANEWYEEKLRNCLDHVRDGGKISETCLIMIHSLCKAVALEGFSDEAYDRFFSVGTDMMAEDEETACELLSLAAHYCKNGFDKTAGYLAAAASEKKTPGEGELTLLSAACSAGKKDDRIYFALRYFVKKADIHDPALRLYFMLVKDYGDPRAVSFMRTKVELIRQAYFDSASAGEAADALLNAAYFGDGVIRELGGEGFF